MPRSGRRCVPTLTLAGVVLCGVALLGGCSGGGSAGAPQAPPGSELDKPGGGTFFVDENHGGAASRMHLAEINWGRLVDVHQLDAHANQDPSPVFRDVVVRETVLSDGLNYRLETNPITQRTRLVILRHRGNPDDGSGTFESLLASAMSNLAPVLPRPDDGSSSGPFSLLARNACLTLRLDDLLDDGPEARIGLGDTVRVISGYPPLVPFGARIVFDPNHGGIAGGAFHSTRILIDMTVSEEERQASPFPLVVNALGLPASLPGSPQPNVSVRIPSHADPGSGVFELLTNLAGAALDTHANGPVDLGSPTLDIVRAMRAGRQDDGNNGFLLDLNKPELIGGWPVLIQAAVQDPEGASGFDFILELDFTTPCRRAPSSGEILQVGDSFLEVSGPATAPGPDGHVGDVRARWLAEAPLTDPAVLRGGALYLSTYAPGLVIAASCWVTMIPPPGSPPGDDVSPDVSFVARFSEPMSPASVDPFETFRLVRGNAGTTLQPTNLVVAAVQPSLDLREFTLRPLLPLATVTDEYRLDLVGGAVGVTDLAGNGLLGSTPPIEVLLDPNAPSETNGGLSLRFSATDEIEPIGKPDVRGQFLYDLERGTIRGRGVSLGNYPADRSNPVPSIMIPFLPGVQTPLSALGSKLQTVWRYCDLGWEVSDESKHNLDVIGVSWAPVGGTVISDFFELFEMRLAHSRRLPDEYRTPTGTVYPCSGLGAGAFICPPCVPNVPFDDNILQDPRSPQKIVHERSRGYHIRAADLFLASSGTVCVPYPMNREGAPFTSYTWRDTSIQARDGFDSPGIPLLIETSPPLNLVAGPAGRIEPPGRVSSYGLPLLIEIRCFPSNSGIGLNPLQIYLAQNSQQLPNFRAYSTGGVDRGGIAVRVNPDLEPIPQGGFNPGSRPPGAPTLGADNSFYAGQLDTIVRVSRAHTIWLQALLDAPFYLPPVVSPRADEQVGTARIELEFRGATGFTGAGLNDAFDARLLNPYGDLGEGEVQFLNDDTTWSPDITHLEGARFVQMRISFVNDLTANATPELSAVGIAYGQR